MVSGKLSLRRFTAKVDYLSSLSVLGDSKDQCVRNMCLYVCYHFLANVGLAVA
jgi:hypothetical protein